jgi:transcriptional regulator with XRE-family HTH domain
MSDSLGVRLRRQRERRGLTIADISTATKIGPAMLEALERDDVSRWPSGIFRRAFVRSYAEIVGLDPEDVVREFTQCFPDPAGPSRRTPASASGDADAEKSSALRLTLAEGWTAFSAARLVHDASQRLKAVAWDAGVVVGVALLLFIATNRFWMALGIAALCYYVGGILMIGNSPGVYLFAPRPKRVSDEPAPPKLSRWRARRPAAPEQLPTSYRPRRPAPTRGFNLPSLR